MRLATLAVLPLVCLGALVASGQDRQPALTPELGQRLGEMLARDWEDPPEWAVEMSALLKGGGMGPGEGWFQPSESRYDFAWLQKHYDKDQNQKLAADELPDSDLRGLYFARLDANRDGRVTADDFQPPQMSPQQRFASQLFYRLDVDSNGRVTESELTKFFAAADRDGLGFLTPTDWEAALAPPARRPRPSGPPPEPPSPGDMIAMLLNGELGSLGEGPELNAAAPKFELKRHDADEKVALAEVLEEGKPVVLIFGSFT